MVQLGRSVIEAIIAYTKVKTLKKTTERLVEVVGVI
jgi:hypothetical protein